MTTRNSSEAQLNGAEPDFLNLLPQVLCHARRAFRHLSESDRDDAIAESIAAAFVSFTSLSQRGIDSARFSCLMARYAVSHVRDGRLVGGRRNSKDVLSRVARKSKGFQVGPLSDEALLDPRTSIPDQVAFKIDFPVFLESLPTRDRAMVLALAEGIPAREVAERFGVSSARVTQLRQVWLARWRESHGEHHADLTASTEWS